MLAVFPPYVDPFEEIYARMEDLKLLDKHIDQVIRTPGREPSPQPTHFSVSRPKRHGSVVLERNGHRVLRSATVGYIAPTFEGKTAQIAEG